MRRGRANPAAPVPSVDPVRMLHRRYAAAFVLVASLVVLNQALVQPPLVRLMTDAPVINVAGRQRMLSQRLAKAALALDRAKGDADRRRHLGELGEVLALWSDSHNGLRRGDPGRSLPGRNSRAVREAFEEIRPFYERMRDAASGMIRADSGVEDAHRGLSAILGAEADYLWRMDRIVGLYEREARARVDRLRWTGRAVSGTILVALIGIGLLILRPASGIIRRQFGDLSRARDELEDRVRERTGELESANRNLAREVSERAVAEERHRALLEQFSHVARTNTIGEMASGLAHELSQPLGAIANYAEGCLVELDAPRPAIGEVRAAIEKILATTLRAGEILKRIRRFVTRHGTDPEAFDPNRVVEDVEPLFQDEIRRRGISLRLDLAPDLPKIWGDPVQIQQVLVNLVRNAFDALGDSKIADPTVVMQTRRSETGDVEFLVTDPGEGIPSERLGRVFDAFFSTRAEGMGMGLAIGRTIVEAHHGRIAVESEPAVRTTFRFTLPPAGADDAAADGLHRGR